MKVLIVLALVAVASANEVQPVELPEAPMPAFEMPDIRPVYVPEEVLRQVKLANEVPVNSEDGLMVHVVDIAPSNEVHFVDEVQEDAGQYFVNFVDFPFEAEQQEVPVDSVIVADIVPPRYPAKVYDDPRLR